MGGGSDYAVIENNGKNTYKLFGTVKLTYPTNIKVEYNQIYHQVRLTWDKVEDAKEYGIAIYQAGKWRIQKQGITTTSYTTPRDLTPGKSYKVMIAAKVDGEWDTANAIKHAVTIYIPNDTDSDGDGIEDFYEKEENVSSYTIAPINDSWIDDSESISGKNPTIPLIDILGMNIIRSTTPVSPEDNNGPRKNELIAIRKRKSGSTDAQFSITPSKNSDFAFTITGTKETKFGEGYTTDDYESTVKVFYEKGVILTEEEQVEPVEIKPSKNGTEITYVFALEQDKDYKIYVNNPTNDHKGEYEIHISEDNWVYAPDGGIRYNVEGYWENGFGIYNYVDVYFSNQDLLKRLRTNHPGQSWEYLNAWNSKRGDVVFGIASLFYDGEELLGIDDNFIRDFCGEISTAATFLGVVPGTEKIFGTVIGLVGAASTATVILFDDRDSKDFENDLKCSFDLCKDNPNGDISLCYTHYKYVSDDEFMPSIDIESGSSIYDDSWHSTTYDTWTNWSTLYINKYVDSHRFEVTKGLNSKINLPE